MQLKSFFLCVLFITFCTYSNLIHAKALIGVDVRSVHDNEYPSVVCIARYIPQQLFNTRIVCTGTIVAPTLVLTAESCFNSALNNAIEIIMPSRNLTVSPTYYPIWWIGYDTWAASQNRNIPTAYNDILLAKVVGPLLDFVPTPIGAIEHLNVMYGVQAQMVGCGRVNTGHIPTVQQTVSTRIMSLKKCSEIYSSFEKRSIEITDKFICTAGNPYRFLDYGDTGGPLLIYGALVGVNIGARPVLDGSFSPGKLNMHINLNAYTDFFNDMIKLP